MNMRPLTLASLLSLCIAVSVSGADEDTRPTIGEKTSGMTRFEGFIPFYWDDKEGKVWLEIEKWDEEFLYMVSLPAGVGSNDIGLDRGQLGRSRIVYFHRSGPTVLLIEPNYEFRAVTTNAAERRAVRDAFATSVLGGFRVEAEEGGAVLIDATSFLLTDAHGIVSALSRSGQGSWSIDPARSAFHLPMMKNFPLNAELEVLLTFTGKDPGGWVRSVTPTPEALSVRQRHSFVRLPDDEYVPRRFDPRGGFFGIQYADYATSIGEPLTQRFIARHRLQKKDPDAPMSKPFEPIVYYVDPGTPEPIRSALLDGARWWEEAFRAAGFIDAFRVDVLPDDADPMDIRYNVIQWVHRSTRGWSYGASVIDPRTGEIIKGHVSLGSLRARQDYLIAEGLLAPYELDGVVPSEMQEMALARLRQLSAHEVGHTLGLSHNYIASTLNRASVMDYPHPYASLTASGAIDLSAAYTQGIGVWDKVAIEFGYREYPEETHADSASREVLFDALNDGVVFLTDQDARPHGSAHPATHLWDNGANASDELDRVMRVRRTALERFSEKVIPTGRPLATIEEALVPLYLSHRYQVEATAKLVAGATYSYAHRGDGQQPWSAVPATDQRHALDALLRTLAPDVLVLPERIVALIPPRPYGFGRHRELFSSRTLPLFDRISPAEAAAHHTLSLLLNPERAERLVQQSAVDRMSPGLREVLDALLEATWGQSPAEGLPGEVRRAVQSLVLEHLFGLAANRTVSTQVRAVTTARVHRLLGSMKERVAGKIGNGLEDHLRYAIDRTERFLKDPAEFTPRVPTTIPPGQPIGSSQMGCDSF